MKKKTKTSKKPELAPKYQQVLREQMIDENRPGTILRDFEIFLDFVATEVPTVSKKNNMLLLKVLTQLNSRLTNPLNIDLKRPVQKSYPHINGLYLLLRASGIGYIEGSGPKLHLALDEATLQSWSNLNPTEQYCTLLETWLLRSSPEIVGERGGGLWNDPVFQWSSFFDRMKGNELKVAGNRDTEQSLRYVPGLYTLALLELFGFITIEHGDPAPGKGWCILSVKKTPLGEAMVRILSTPAASTMEGMLLQSLMYKKPTIRDEFGQLQIKLQEFFPEWQNNLTLPKPEIREGTYIFKVSLGRPWRRIAIPGEMLLDHLSWTILNAFEFDHDHLYSFICKDHFGKEIHINHSYVEEPPFTDEVRVQEAPLRVGGSMIFLFDFGDNWEFTVQLERIDPVDRKLKKAKVLEKKGNAPEQYPVWDEEW